MMRLNVCFGICKVTEKILDVTSCELFRFDIKRIGDLTPVRRCVFVERCGVKYQRIVCLFAFAILY